MATAFNFENTPITEQTILVARYSSDAPQDEFAGKWFRATTTDGKQYVPADATQAIKFAKAGTAESYPLISVETGEESQVAPGNTQKIEFGYGWDEISYQTTMFRLSDSNTFTSLRYVSGYPQGLTIDNCATFLSSATGAPKLDVTGLKFDLGNWNLFVENGNLFMLNAGSATSNVGVYGVVQPLFPPRNESLDEYAFCSKGAHALDYFNYTKGTGFVGEYAKEWLEKFPTLTSGSSSNTRARKTYLG